jgi:hypothetical protein
MQNSLVSRTVVSLPDVTITFINSGNPLVDEFTKKPPGSIAGAQKFCASKIEVHRITCLKTGNVSQLRI